MPQLTHGAVRPMDLTEWRRKAVEIGLDRLTDEHLRQLARASAGMSAQLALLPRDFAPDEEPATVFRAEDFLIESEP